MDDIFSIEDAMNDELTEFNIDETEYLPVQPPEQIVHQRIGKQKG